MINPSQRPLPDNTQLSQQTNIHAPGGIRTHNLSRRAAKTYALDRAATGTDFLSLLLLIIITFMQGIYNYIPERNNVSRVYSIAAFW